MLQIYYSNRSNRRSVIKIILIITILIVITVLYNKIFNPWVTNLLEVSSVKNQLGRNFCNGCQGESCFIKGIMLAQGSKGLCCCFVVHLFLGKMVQVLSRGMFCDSSRSARNRPPLQRLNYGWPIVHYMNTTRRNHHPRVGFWNTLRIEKENYQQKKILYKFINWLQIKHIQISLGEG